MNIIEPNNGITAGDIFVVDGEVYIVGRDVDGFHLRKFDNPENTMHKSWAREKRHGSESFMHNLMDFHSTVVHYSQKLFDLKLVPKK